MFTWSFSVLNPRPASDIIRLEELGTMRLDNSVWPVEQGSIIYQHQLSTLCLNENRAAVIIYYRVSIPSGIFVLRIIKSRKLKKKQFQFNRGLEPKTFYLKSQLSDWYTQTISANMAGHALTLYNLDNQYSVFFTIGKKPF